MTQTQSGPTCEPMAAGSVETNPLLQFLGGDFTSGPDGEARCALPVYPVRRVLLGPGGAVLFQKLARSSRVRFHASLALLQISEAGQPAIDIVGFLDQASDDEILCKVIESVEGPGPRISTGLKAALKRLGPGEPPCARSIGMLNRLIGRGCSIEGALNASGRRRLPLASSAIDFAERNQMHRAALAAAHLCDTERQVLVLDMVFRLLERRAPDLVPGDPEILRLESYSELSRLMQKRMLRYRGKLPMPPIVHPDLEWIDSLPRLREVGVDFRNCVGSSVYLTLTLLFERGNFAIYRDGSDKYLLQVNLAWEEGRLIVDVEDIRGFENSKVPGAVLGKMIASLEEGTGHTWRLGYMLMLIELKIDEAFNAYHLEDIPD